MSSDHDPNTLPLPDGWPSSGFSDFILHLIRHQFATYENKRGDFLRLTRIDQIFESLLNDWENPTAMVPALLCYRTHSAFRIASIVTMSGALTESFALQRLCLEQAGYAVRISRDHRLAEIWLRRDEDDETARSVRREFTHTKIREAIRMVDERVAVIFSELYESHISWGAHPNEKALSNNGRIDRRNEKTHFSQIYLHADGPSMNMTFRLLMQTAVCSLDLLRLIFPERFRIADIASKMEHIRSRL